MNAVPFVVYVIALLVFLAAATPSIYRKTNVNLVGLGLAVLTVALVLEGVTKHTNQVHI